MRISQGSMLKSPLVNVSETRLSLHVAPAWTSLRWKVGIAQIRASSVRIIEPVVMLLHCVLQCCLNLGIIHCHSRFHSSAVILYVYWKLPISGCITGTHLSVSHGNNVLYNIAVTFYKHSIHLTIDSFNGVFSCHYCSVYHSKLQPTDAGYRLASRPTPGMLVCACFTRDDNWYRARVISIHVDSRTGTCVTSEQSCDCKSHMLLKFYKRQ